MPSVKFKRSAVASRVPTTSDLALGEIGINTYDGKLYIKKDNGTASVVEIGAAATVANGVIYENSLTISSNYTMTAGKSGSSVGNITVASGVTVTIPSGSRWVIL